MSKSTATTRFFGAIVIIAGLFIGIVWNVLAGSAWLFIPLMLCFPAWAMAGYYAAMSGLKVMTFIPPEELEAVRPSKQAKHRKRKTIEELIDDDPLKELDAQGFENMREATQQ